jgi:enamine deaminase RidA (YjgF/YER057c/UK114 family)
MTGGSPHAYSDSRRAGDLLYLAAQGPVDRVTGEVVGTTIEEQTERTIRNAADLLARSGATLGDLVKVTVYLADLSLFHRYDAAYVRHVPDPRPPRTTLGVGLLDVMIEMDFVAYVGLRAH